MQKKYKTVSLVGYGKKQYPRRISDLQINRVESIVVLTNLK
jgi:hypothetical protein